MTDRYNRRPNQPRILLKEDFNYSVREIAERMGMSESGVNYVLNNIRRK